MVDAFQATQNDSCVKEASFQHLPAMKLNEILPGFIHAQPKDVQSMQDDAHLHNRAQCSDTRQLSALIVEVRASMGGVQAGRVRVKPLA